MELQKEWEVEIYSTDRGREPFAEWKDQLDYKLECMYMRMQAMILTK